MTNVAPALDAERAKPVRNVGDFALIAAGLLALLALVVAILQPPWMHTTIWLPMLFVLVAAGPFVLVGKRLHTRVSAPALGAASAFAYVTVITVLAVTWLGPMARRVALRGSGGVFSWLFAAVTVGWHLVEDVMSTPGYVLLVLLTGVCLFLVVHVRRARVTLDLTVSFDYMKGWCLACLYSIVAVPVLFMLSNAQSERGYAKNVERSRVYDQVSVYVRKTLRRVQTCLYDHAAAHPNEGFPRDLEAAAAEGTVCFDPKMADELFVDSRLRYAANPPDSTGRISGFWLVAEPMSEKALWRKQYYADETGLVYYGDMRQRDDSIVFHGKIPDAPLPPPRELLTIVDSPASDLVALQRCLAQRDLSEAPFPVVLDGNRCLRSRPFAVGDAITLSVHSRFQTEAAGGTYLLIYRARRPVTDTTAAGYVMELRPREYGVDGTRSYWTDELRHIHWTRDDRPATPNDPVVETCEIESSCES